MFHIYVAKVDRDVAYVAMVVHVCCKLLFPIFHLFCRRILQLCLFGCCICFTHMFQVFLMFQRYVAIVSDECCKSRSECCICCNGCTRILQKFVPNVSSVFLDVLLQVCFFGCCICFTHILQVFYLDIAYVCNGFQVFFMCFCKCFRGMFQVFHLSLDVCCKCCIWMFQR